MTDRELLELAAKAAGLEIVRPDDWPNERAMLLRGIEAPWNPIDDDGDALRLAVVLNLEVVCDDTTEHMPFAYASLMATDLRAFEPVVACPYAATRRAIVRAAAAIGEQMP